MRELVSIIMPSYNTGKFIASSVESVLAQTYENWELIIVDDCSTDDTETVLKPYMTDKRIRFFKNELNSGGAVTRNRALREAKGKWIAFLDSDDLWTKDKLEKQVRFMEENGYRFSYTQYEQIGEEGEPLGCRVTGPKRIGKAGMFAYCWPGCLTVMYEAEAVGLVQIADIRKNNDYAIWLKVCRKEKCYLLDEALAFYRRRSGSVSNHRYISLIRWHYKLFREAEGMNTLTSLFWTFVNLGFGVVKKLVYVKNYNR